MIKKTIRPDAFIHAAVKSVNLSGEEEGLFQKFREKYRDRIQELYNVFLQEEALERLAGIHPVLRTKINDTPLPNQAKNVLRAADVVTVGDLVQFSPDELRAFRNMGAGTVKEIEKFVASLGI